MAGRDHASLLTEYERLNWPPELPDGLWDGGYEPWKHEHFSRRAREVVAVLQQVDTPGVIALITHADFSQSLLQELLHLSLEYAFKLDNTGTTFLEVNDTGVVLHWLNRLPA